MINKTKFKSIIKKADNDSEVVAIALFGSSLKRRGRDIDLCIFLNKKLSNLEMSKKQLEFAKTAKKNLDIQIFQQLPIYIRTRVLKEGKILLCKDTNRLYEIALETAQEFGFFKKCYDMYLEKVRNG